MRKIVAVLVLLSAESWLSCRCRLWLTSTMDFFKSRSVLQHSLSAEFFKGFKVVNHCRFINLSLLKLHRCQAVKFLPEDILSGCDGERT